MKRVYIIVVFILVCLYDLSAQQWGIAHVQHSRNIYSIVIANPQNITISGGFDYTDPIEAVYHSTDFGLNWPENPTDTINFCVRSIAFADTMHGFGTGFFGHYVHTTDGGYTWTRDTLPINRNFFKAIDVTPSIAFLAGGEELGSNMQTILKSTNGAATWTIVRDTAGPVLRSIYFIDTLRGTAIGDSGTILRTIDGGNTWIAVAAPVQLNFNSITFINADTGYIVGGSQGVNSMRAILQTTDGGATWTILMNQPGTWFADISFLNKDTGYIVGDAATLMQSIDGGQSWVPQTVTSANGSESFTSVRFYDRGFGIIGSLNGAGVFVYANPPVPAAQTGNVIFFGNNITLTGSANTHGSPANVSFIIGSDSLFTSFAETPYPQTITSTSMVMSQYGITGFLGAGTYYFACKVTNTGGSYYGDTVRFVIPDSAAILNALPYTNGRVTSLTLQGQVSRMPVSSNIYFEYSILGDTVIHTVAATPATTNDTLMHNISASITGIIPNVQYQYRVKAISGREILYSDYFQFNLSTGNIVVNTFPATNVTFNSATLQGQVSGFHLPSTLWFEYILNGVTTTVPAVPASVNDTLPHNVSAPLNGLMTDSIYQYRLKVIIDSSYTVYGNYNTFFTNPSSTGNIVISTLPATNVTFNSATLQGQVSHLHLPSTLWFEYVLNGVTTTVSAVPASVNDSLPHSVSAQLNGLMTDSIYQYRLKVIVDSSYTLYGNYSTFFTSPSSTGNIVISTFPATNVSFNSATLQGQVSHLHLPSTLWFEYMLNGVTTIVSAVPASVSDSLPHSVSAQLNGLMTDSIYQYRLKVIVDSSYTLYANYNTFFTSPSSTGNIVISTLPAINVTTSSATLEGQVSGLPLPSTLWFEYMLNGVANTVSAVPASVNDTFIHNVSAQLNGLMADSLYQYRIKVIINSSQTDYGNYMPLITAPASAATLSVDSSTNIGYTSATLFGHAGNLHYPAQVYFNYWTGTSSVTTVPASPGYINDTLMHVVSTQLTGLVPNSHYNYYLTVTDSPAVGQTSNVLQFYTGIGDVIALPCTNSTSASATLNGRINLLPLPGLVYFEFWTNGNPVTTLPGTPASIHDILSHTVTAQVNGLMPDITYQYRVKVEDSLGGITYSDSLALFTGVNTIPNFDFENWTQVTGEKAVGWFNFLGPATRVSPGAAGSNYAVSLASTPLTQSFLLNALLDMGAQNGLQFIGGVPYNARPDTLTGMFKYNVVSGDSSVIILGFKSHGQMISENVYYITGSSPVSFQQLKFPITYSSSAIPDTMMIGISAAHLGPNAPNVVGSWLIVDELAFAGNYPPVPNGGFEDWQSYTYKKLDNWTFLDMTDFGVYTNPDSQTVMQTTDAQHGNYAAELNCMNSLNWLGGGNGAIESVIGFMKNNAPSFALNHKVHSLNGYYKYLPLNGDTMHVECDVFKNGVQIGMGTMSSSMAETAYTPFSVNITYSIDEVPDSGYIMFSTGTGAGTHLILDNLSFDGFISSVEEINAPQPARNDLKIFPNPSSSLVRIQSSIDINGRLEIYDMQGMLVASDRFTGNNQQLDIRNFNPGIYLVRVISGENIMSQRMVIIK